MKVLLINGSPNAEGAVNEGLSAIADQLKKEGVEAVIYQIGADDDEPSVNAAAREISEIMQKADGLIVGTPDYFASPSGKLTAILDKVFLKTAPLVYKPAAGIVSGRRTGCSAALDVLNKYFLMTNMPVVPSNYYNAIHGGNAKEVLVDVEGMQTLRILARNMAWMLKNLETGKQQGISLPEQEKKIKFSVVR